MRIVLCRGIRDDEECAVTWLRPATMLDADHLFTWRNDPVTCACFRSTAAVPREDHDRWMKFNVMCGYPEHIVLMAENPMGRIGVVRFDSDKRDVLTFEASITIAPRFRGMGLAREILSDACGMMSEYTIDAEIRADNRPSRRIFEQCGFSEVGSDHEFVQYRKGPAS